MSKLSLKLTLLAPSYRGAVLAMLAVTLAGCVTQFGVEGSSSGYYADSGYADPGYGDAQTSEAPPPLPDYEQPPCPEDGYLWTPGYWAWSSGYSSGYYWVPGTWVQPPAVGLLWTPGYWGFAGSAYVFHGGYWGPHVGFYGGVNYGFGYTGTGFAGGAWRGNRYSYNRAVTNVNVNIVHNTYNTTVINNFRGNRASYNGGAGGIAAAPTSQDRQFARDRHDGATAMQRQHRQQAAQDPALFSRANGGRPAIAATPRAAAFNGPGVVGAHGAAAQVGGRPGQPYTAPRSQQAPDPGRAPYQTRPLNHAQPPNPAQPPNQAQLPNQAPAPNQARPFNQGRYPYRAQPPNQAQPLNQGQAPNQAQPYDRGRTPYRTQAPRQVQPANREQPPNQARPPSQRPDLNQNARPNQHGKQDRPHVNKEPERKPEDGH